MLTPLSRKTPGVVHLHRNAVLAVLTAGPMLTAFVVAPRASVPADTVATPSAAVLRRGEPVVRTGATVLQVTSAAQTAARQWGDSAARTGRSAILGISASSVDGLGSTAAALI